MTMPAWWAREHAPALAEQARDRMAELRGKSVLTEREREELRALESNAADTTEGQLRVLQRAVT